MASHSSGSILVVEDDPSLRQALALALTQHGFELATAEDGDQALAMADARPPAIVLLDVMLPGRSGIEVCAELRARHHPAPGIIMITARTDEVDVVLGLEVGADDYVLKPFRVPEIIARIRALSRRLGAGLAREEPVFEHGALSVDPAKRLACVSGRSVPLTQTEFSLLHVLVSAPGRVFPRIELLERVWESTHEGYARNVDCHITRLRRKLAAAGVAPVPIRTAHGIGYAFDDGHDQ